MLENFSLYNVSDKNRVVNDNIRYMLSRTSKMFKYNGLTDKMPRKYLERYLQTQGYAGVVEYNGEVYVLYGTLGGEPDEWGFPTLFIVANPALNLNKTYTIGKDCVVILNDSSTIGLLPMFRKYATALCENELSMKIATVNSRAVSLISAMDDRTVASAEKYIEDLERGKLSVVAENNFLDGVRVQPYSSSITSNITNLIELEQYLKASWFNEVGLNANYNMKRESINSGESQLNTDALSPMIEDMLRCREEGIEKVNEMFGLNITVELDSAWKENKIEINEELKAINSEDADSIEDSVVQEDVEEVQEDAQEDENMNGEETIEREADEDERNE